MSLKGKIITILSVLFIFLVALFSSYYKDELYKFYKDLIFKQEQITINANQYYKDDKYLYIQNTTDFYAKDNNHLKNIFYTIINSGVDAFTFYCDYEYNNCLHDVEALANNQIILSSINNYVHPYNSFEKINVTYTSNGKITITFDKTYTKEEIDALNKRVDEIINEVITEDMNDYTKIRTIHDYIINNSNYAPDELINDDDNIYKKATGNLLNEYGICSGYADSMALFLEKFNIDNYKIASETHVWNLVKVNDEWFHLDLTWDDPIYANGEEHLELLFFLINQKRLDELNTGQHIYDNNLYLEINNNN